ncbi:extracellular solute-binding protein [Paenibacillus woosongensis]|uniref:Extracellular solute-binding protein n=1 Tax=Paenibacillus woosongensis TaxID=307580 RepID=A0A7X2Z4L1_9BACL|nr:extracellular solute-binding protein [Paenibacillus woosongensis]MUG46721.1 extracellular solute-binding protein [Paenibacillus woosongensis]
MPLLRSLTSIMVVTAILSFMMGCNGLAGSNKSGHAEGASRSLGADESAPTDRWTTLRIELFERNNKPVGANSITDNYITQYIQKHFGDPARIKVEFITIPRAEEVGRLQVLMAANQAPDIVFTYDLPTVYNFVTQGKLTDLSPLLDQYGQDLKTVLGEEILSYGRINGMQFAIPAKRVLTARSTTLIREDWLKEAELPLPETTEQFYQALKAFKKIRLEKYGETIYPYGHIDYYHIAPLQYSFWDWGRITEEDLYADPGWIMPGNKEAFKFLNQLYHEGLIDPDFHLDRYAQQFQKDLVNGRVGAATPNTIEPVYMGYLAELQKNDPNAILTPIDPFTNANGKKTKPILEKTGMYIMVPKTSRNAEAAIKYLNWMAQPENYITLQNGIEGVTYEMENGLPVTLENDDANTLLFNYFDYCIILNGKYVSSTDEQLNLKANASIPSFEDFALQSVEYGMNDGIATPRIPTILPSEIKYSAILNDKNDEIFVKVLTAKPEEFDSVYDQEVAEYMMMGGRQVQEEKHRAYQDHK